MASKRLLKWSKRAPRGSKSAPRDLQERSISPWKPPLSRPDGLSSSKRPPRDLQNFPDTSPALPGTPPGRPREAPTTLKIKPGPSKRPPKGLFIQATLDPSSQATFLDVLWPRALGPISQARRNARERLNLRRKTSMRRSATLEERFPSSAGGPPEVQPRPPSSFLP